MNANERSPQDKESLQRLLEEGARSYFDAVTVIAEYQREVKKKCRAVLKKHLTAYQSALGIDLGEKDIKDCVELDSDYANVGVTIDGTTKTPGCSWWTLYCCLGWEYGAGSLWFGPWVGICLPKKVAAALHARMQLPGIKEVPKTVWLGQKLEVHEAVDFEEKLEEILCKWIDAWKPLHGFKGFLSSIQSQALDQE